MVEHQLLPGGQAKTHHLGLDRLLQLQIVDLRRTPALRDARSGIRGDKIRPCPLSWAGYHLDPEYGRNHDQRQQPCHDKNAPEINTFHGNISGQVIYS